MIHQPRSRNKLAFLINAPVRRVSILLSERHCFAKGSGSDGVPLLWCRVAKILEEYSCGFFFFRIESIVLVAEHGHVVVRGFVLEVGCKRMRGIENGRSGVRHVDELGKIPPHTVHRLQIAPHEVVHVHAVKLCCDWRTKCV